MARITNRTLLIIFIILFAIAAQGCKQNMDLKPEDYFEGQQLILAKAIYAGSLDEVSRLAGHTDLNKPGRHDMTLLFFAIGNATEDKATPKRLAIITELVKTGADALQPRPAGKASPAEFVAQADRGIWLKALIDGGMSPDARDKINNRPILFDTEEAKNTETLKTLLENGADADARNALGETLLMSSFYSASFEHMKYLIKHGALLNPSDETGVNLATIIEQRIKTTKDGSDFKDNCLEIKKMLIDRGVKWPAS